ncbi:hypothetical protein CASFOL_041817 [Castilleja foliolosa]|uniref:Cyclin N-terminal domain-containing protein n=1 Tax=Castilleja foliolosa TaxID=1961234 RepID=A0ABD3B975_9LAMI
MEQSDEVQNDPYEDFFHNPGKEVFASLFSAEAYFMVPQTYFKDEFMIASRKTAVQIIEKNYPPRSGYFDPLIAYMALTYFDRFYSRYHGYPRVMRETARSSRNATLFAICCLTIAWKLREKSFRLTSFLREKDISYGTEAVLQMELQICRGLKWRMRTVTPFLFVGFFIPYLEMPSARSIVHNLIYRAQREIAFTEYRPSVIAMSAMLAISSGMVSAEHVNDLIRKFTDEFELLKPLQGMIEESMNRLRPLYWSPPAEQDDQTQNQNEQLEEEEDPNENHLACCTCNTAISAICVNIKDACNIL